ncbi:histidine phosphatase superfamily [Lentinula aciculospora]|uniref:Histidine phosphatase superfamily n=1 Tax=Lentinula aciculospora TaxID=153920 RepID=A0A9W9DR50_9AGAR|nr:histidine phosphatase superfamily [Lentinula aciculospora]
MSKRRIYLLRHGQAMHNVDKSWPARDPPLTELGIQQSEAVLLPTIPDFVVCSPMRRTIQTMHAVLSKLNLDKGPSRDDIPIEIWPNLREATNAPHNNGSSKAEMVAAYPLLDFIRCNEEWDYEENTDETAAARAVEVLEELRTRPEMNILVVGHRVFFWYLVGGKRFVNCELRSYEFNETGTMVEIERL